MSQQFAILVVIKILNLTGYLAKIREVLAELAVSDNIGFAIIDTLSGIAEESPTFVTTQADTLIGVFGNMPLL